MLETRKFQVAYEWMHSCIYVAFIKCVPSSRTMCGETSCNDAIPKRCCWMGFGILSYTQASLMGEALVCIVVLGHFEKCLHVSHTHTHKNKGSVEPLFLWRMHSEEIRSRDNCSPHFRWLQQILRNIAHSARNSHIGWLKLTTFRSRRRGGQIPISMLSLHFKEFVDSIIYQNCLAIV